MLNYKMITYMIDTDKGAQFVAEYPVLTGVSGTGTTDIEAIQDLKSNAMAHIDVLKELGLPIPEENINALNIDNFSGKISYRPGKYVHMKLSETANNFDISINTLINNAVSAYIGNENSQHIEELKEDIQQVQQMIQANHGEIKASYFKKNNDNKLYTTQTKNQTEQFAA